MLFNRSFNTQTNIKQHFMLFKVRLTDEEEALIVENTQTGLLSKSLTLLLYMWINTCHFYGQTKDWLNLERPK